MLAQATARAHVAPVTHRRHDFRHGPARTRTGYDAGPMRRRTNPAEAVGVLLLLACSQLALMSIYNGRMTGIQAYAWFAAFAVFGITLLADLAMRIVLDQSRAVAIGIFCTLLASAFVMLVMVDGLDKYAQSGIIILVASRLPGITSERGAWLILAGIEVVWIVILYQQESLAAVFGSGSAIAAAMVYSVAFARQGMRERAAHAALALANAELRASRELLAENSRAAERLRISRDIHDALGHHLTALSIRLDIASRREGELAVQDIREAHAITRLMLSDVRDVVGTLRRDTSTDAVALIRPMCKNIGELSIQLDAPESALPIDAERAEALVRCVQEVITNTLKHARARNLWITLAPVEGGMTVRARDDGRGVQQLRPGTGLTGMRERFAQFGGEVSITTNAGSGFALQAFVPAASASA
jgi:signal transduction histidine kinase